jgi:hypothetical protein
MPLHKGKGSRKRANNYRPIVLLNSFCKIFERFLFHRVYERVSSHLITEQHAFREGKSCHTALSIFTQYVYDKLDKKKNKVVDLKKPLTLFLIKTCVEANEQLQIRAFICQNFV